MIADEHVDPEFGTGALKITPGHDPNDFEIGRKHGLEEISVIGEDGRITDAAPERFRGMTVAEAQEAVVDALREEGADPRRGALHALGPVLAPLRRADRAADLAAVVLPDGRDGEARDRGGPRGEGPVHPRRAQASLPRLDGADPALVHLAPALVGPPAAGLVPRRADEEPEIYVGEEPPEGEGWEQEEDVLDTWFSSALWPFATLGWPDTDAPEFKAFFPTDVLVTARDIIFLWVARMIMTSLEFTGEVPFTDVYVHSVIQAPDGRRMSKSLGTGIDPLDEISEHGADALRFGLLAMSSTQDVRFSQARVQQGRDLANKMWNASRLILLNAREDVEPAPGRERSRTAGSPRACSARSAR